MDETRSIVEEMQAYYARRAPVYDESMGYNDPGVVRRLAPVIDFLREQLAGRTVLELACGPGFWTRAMSGVARCIVASDYNASTIAEARRKTLDPRKVSLVVGDAYCPPFIDATFDAAFAGDWLAHVPRSRQADFLVGLHSALRPGARVLFCDQLPGPESMTGVYDGDGNHLQERTLPDGSRYRVIKHFPTHEEFLTLFSPYASDIVVESFPECRRVVAGYTLRVQ
jgi:ubiquinone/menaquinone biosynthesis C-methylase UbiE